MELVKGSIIRETKRNERKGFENTIANGSLTYRVTRVNPKTYTLECIEGYMKGTACKISKDFKETSTDVYGTVTTWEEI